MAIRCARTNIKGDKVEFDIMTLVTLDLGGGEIKGCAEIIK